MLIMLHLCGTHILCKISSLLKTCRSLHSGCALSSEWDRGYLELLNMFDMPSLENRRLYLKKLFHLFKIVHGLCYFPPDIIVPNPNPSHFPRPYALLQPFARSNSSYYFIRPWLSGTVCLMTSYMLQHTRTLKALSEFSLNLYFHLFPLNLLCPLSVQCLFCCCSCMCFCLFFCFGYIIISRCYYCILCHCA